MYSDTEKWCKSCKECAGRKAPPASIVELKPLNIASSPFEAMGVDILGPLTETYGGNRYIFPGLNLSIFSYEIIEISQIRSC